MEDQRREWELRDNKLREQNEARQELMKRVYQIRADQIAYRLSLKFDFFENFAFRENEKRQEIEEDQRERQRIQEEVSCFKEAESRRNQGREHLA